MGKTVVCNYEIQIELVGSLSQYIMGESSYKNILKTANKVADDFRTGLKVVYVWPQTKVAEKFIQKDFAAIYPDGTIKHLEIGEI
jgi:hypothetical protein